MAGPYLLLVAGSSHLQAYKQCDVYNLQGGAEQVQVADVPQPCSYGAVVSDHRALYVIGGRTDCTDRRFEPEATCFKLSLSSLRWRRIKDMVFTRMFHSACIVQNRIVVTGGLHRPQELQQRLRVGPDERPYLTESQWTMFQGDIMLGASAEQYNITDDTWTRIKDLPRPVGQYKTASCCWRDQAVVSIAESVFYYDFSKQTWGSLPNLVQERHGHCMVSHKEHLYVFGGDLVNTVEMYDPDVGHFVSINIVPSPISYTNAVVHEDNIIIVGHEISCPSLLELCGLAVKDCLKGKPGLAAVDSLTLPDILKTYLNCI